MKTSARTERRPSDRSGNFVSISCCVVICLLFGFAIVGCRVSAEKAEYELGEKAEASKNYASAITHYKNVVQRYSTSELAIKSAQEAGRLSYYEIKNFDEARTMYKHVVLYAPNSKDREEAQKKIAEINFLHLQDYNQAVIEYQRLLELAHSQADGFQYQLAIAKCYFYLNNFFQAQIEIDSILSKGYDKALLFDALLLKANIFLTGKKHDEAIGVLHEIMSKYPERSKNETIGLVLAVTYEEQNNFAKAIETLEQIRNQYPNPAFVDRRIKSMRERLSLMPGAKGLRK